MKEETKKIEVEKDVLDEMIKKIERLEAVQSQAKLKDFDRSIKDKSKKVVGLREIDGKVIVSWSNMIKNIVEKSNKGYWGEDQVVEVEYEDGKKEKMPYVIFNRRFTVLLMEVKKEIKNEDGTTTFVGTTADDKEYKIKDTFLK